MAKELKMEVSLSEKDLEHILEALYWATSHGATFPEQEQNHKEKDALYERFTKTKKRLIARKG